MPANLLLYLAEASFCLGLFVLVYRLCLARLTYFSWNRWYLVGAAVASLVLPLLPLSPFAFLLSAEPDTVTESPLLLLNWNGPAVATVSAPAATSLDWWAWLLGSLALLYATGVVYRVQKLARNLWWLRQLVQWHPRRRHGAGWIVEVADSQLPAFSFGRFIFLSSHYASLDSAERELLLAHELVHVQQRHSLDILLVEGVSVLLWFNPVVPYLRAQLKEVHEYLADATVARTLGLTGYGQLLIKLAAPPAPVSLVHTFSTKQLFLRITMLTTPASRPSQKLRFLLVAPVLLGAWFVTACIGTPAPEAPSAPRAATSAATTPPIGRIVWEGNTTVTTDRLNQTVGLTTGDAYDSLAVAKQLEQVTALYMDQGHLFFNVTPATQRQPGGSVDLTFRIDEGRKAHLGPITFTGNGQVSTQTLLQSIPLRSGDVFSRTKLLEAQKNLALLGPFEPDQVGVNPQPVMRPTAATDLVNIEFALVPKK